MPMSQQPKSHQYDFVFHTWGCKVNTYDTGLLQARLGSGPAPATVAVARPRVHILNTCAVTEEASREAARTVRRLKSKEPLSRIVITGCGAQVDGGIFDALAGVDLVVANSHKGELEGIVDGLFKGTLTERVFRSNIFRKDDLEEGGGLESDHTRAFLKIQDGCNSFCTYCVIPFARGKSRSIPIDRLVKRVGELEAQGAREAVLTGVHIGDYEDVEGTAKRGLADLVDAILQRTTIPRLRLSSLEPVELTDRLLGLFASDRLCRHFHMSIQSACTETLQRMRRQYTADDVETALLQIAERWPEAFVGMDVIAGFPGETEEEFAATYQLLSRLPWTRLHVFPYSERPGTKALKLEGSVPVPVRARRAALLRTLSATRFRQRAEAEVGKTKHGLYLAKSTEPSSFVQLLSRDYWPVRVATGSPRALAAGDEVAIRITGYRQPEQGRMDGWLEGVYEAAGEAR